MKELLDISKEQLRDLTTAKNPDFRLEQVEYRKEEGVWDIVVSYLVEDATKNATAQALNLTLPLLGFQYERTYKRLTVNKDKEIEGFYIYSNQR